MTDGTEQIGAHSGPYFGKDNKAIGSPPMTYPGSTTGKAATTGMIEGEEAPGLTISGKDQPSPGKNLGTC